MKHYRIQFRLLHFLIPWLCALTLAQGASESIEASGPHHRYVTQTSRWPDPASGWKSWTNRYVELADGLNYQASPGTWIPSNPSFQITNGWAFAMECQHKAAICLQSRRTGGIILSQPDGSQLRSHLVGLSYFDSATGQSVLIAEPTDRRGILIHPSQILFRDAFDDVDADVRYTMSLDGFEQDVIFRRPPPSPAEFGLNPESTRLEVLTEFTQSPEPRVSKRSRPTVSSLVPQDPDADADQTLDFGAMIAGTGRAFEEHSTNASLAFVSKRWMRLNQRPFLVESVPYNQIARSLQALDPNAGASITLPTNLQTESPSHQPTSHSPSQRPIPSTTAWPVATTTIPATLPTASPQTMVAANEYRPNGVVIDYLITLSTPSAPLRFRADTTYYISGNTTLSGATFEGGTVLKYAPGASLAVDSAVSEETSPIRPIIFTGATDDSVGEPVNLGTSAFPRPIPTGTFGAPCLWIKGAGSGSAYPCTLDASNFQFAHALTGLRLHGGPNHILRNSQFRDCATAIELIGSSGQTLSASFLNGLIVRCTNAIAASGALVNITAQHLTVASTQKLRDGIPPGIFDLRNSILSAVPDLSGVDTSALKGNSVSTNPSADFTQAGLGAFYLPDGSRHLESCTTASLDPQLVADLSIRTTQPPKLLEGTLTGNHTLSPLLRRTKSNTRLDRGFHYPSLDFIVSNLRIFQGQLKLAPGCSLGIHGSNGIVLGTSGSLLISGSHTAPISIARLQSIQERTYSAVLPPGSPTLRSTDESLIRCEPTALDSTEVSATYTTLTTPSGTGSLIAGNSTLSKVQLRHCQLFGGAMALETPVNLRSTATLDDVLLHGTQLRLASFSNSLTAKIHRATIRASRLALAATPSDSWELGDAILCDVEITYPNAGVSWFNNAFCRATNLTSSGQRTLIGSGNLPGTNSLALSAIQWAKGPLGSFYYTTSALRDRGSSTAAQAGLFHHTTSPTQTKELNSLLDLGYHAPVYANGSPIDTDLDGLSDLDEDPDGNGLLASPPRDGEVVSIETLFTSPDTDADGVSDLVERHKGTNPRRPDFLPESMVAEWNFNEPTFATTGGDPALTGSVATRDTRTWDGYAALISFIPASGTTPAQSQFLAYQWMRTDSLTLLPPETGSLQFWFKPNWSSRTNGIPEDGITTPRKLVSIQAPGDETEHWSLQLNATGTIATFTTLRSGAASPRSTSWNIQFERGVWHQITLTYGHSGVELWKNAERLQPITPVLGTESWPLSQPRFKQLFIGGWSTPSMPRTANGSFEGIRTFNHLLRPEAIQGNYSLIARQDADGDGLPDILELQLAGFSASNRDSDSDGLPDSWEYDFFRDNSAQPLGDPDLDGANNLQEFIQGTNPRIKDSPWVLEATGQAVRSPGDLINIDFVTYPRFSQTGERTKHYDQTAIHPIAASMGANATTPSPREDLWNILPPDQLLHGETQGPTTPIKNASGGVTTLRLSAIYGPIQRWSSDECAQTIADILANRRPESYPAYEDFGIPITRPSLPPIPIATTIEGWCRPAFPPAPIQPNQLFAPSPFATPVDSWQPPASWWIGSQMFQFQAACGGPVGGARIIAVTTPNSPGTGVDRNDTYDALKSLSDYPPCTGTMLQFFRPAFQSGSEFANTASDWSSSSVTTHPMLVDYLTTTEESAAWRSLLESNGFDLSDAHSRLQISGIPPGPWRVIVYSASENDQRSCPIVFQPATSTFIPFVNTPPWVPSPSDSLSGISEFSADRTVTSIQPGPRHGPAWLPNRHHVQATVDISSDGVLNLQFVRNAVLNGIQLVRLRPLESPQWIGLHQSNSTAGVILRWSPVPTATHYSVQRADAPIGPWIDLVSELRSTAHRDTTTSLNSNGQPRQYWYRIQAFNERFQSASEPTSTTVSSQSIANRPPVLSLFHPLGPVFQGQPFQIGLADLQSNAIASDFDNDPLEFRVEHIIAGSLSFDGILISESELQSRAATNPLANLIRKGSTVRWHPTADLPGIVPAIELRAFDGTQFSDQSAILPLLVKTPNQVVWWGSNLSETAGNGQSVNRVALESKYPGRRRYIRSDPEYWSAAPAPVSGPDNGRLLNVIQLAAKNDITLALKGDGTVWSWGRGDARLGLGSPGCPPLPTPCDLPWFSPGSVITPYQIQFPLAAGNLRQVALGSAHAAALSNDGSVYLWGAETSLAEGMIDAPTRILGILPPSSLRTATTVGSYNPESPEERDNALRFSTLGTGIPTLVPNLANIRQIACSDHAIAVLAQDGSVWDWGTLTYLDTREIRSGPGGAITTLGAHRRILDSASPTVRIFPTKPIQIAAAANTFFATLESGEVYAWGANDSGAFADPSWTFDITDPLSVGTLTPRRIPGLSGIQMVRASDSYVLALSRSGTVFEWGRSLVSGQPIQPPRPLLDLPRIESISVTTSAAFAIDPQGHAWGWGHNGDFSPTPEYSIPNGLLDPQSIESDVIHPRALDFLPVTYDVSAPHAAGFHAIASLLPSSPQQLAATPTGNSIRLTWRAFPGASSYRIYRTANPSSQPELHFSTSASPNSIQEFIDTSVTTGVNYYYRVTAVVAVAETAPSSMVWTRVQSQPGAIAGFGLTSKSRSMQLTWCAETNASAYEIHRAGPMATQATPTRQADFTTRYSLTTSQLISQLRGVPDCATNQFRFTDSELEPGRWYVYRIRAVNESGQGPFVESRQAPQSNAFGPPPPSITAVRQANTTAVIQFQTNHPPQETQWVVHLYHHQHLTPSNGCIVGSNPVEPARGDPGWVLDRSVVLPDIQGAWQDKMALSVAPSSSMRAILIDALPAGVWHKVEIFTVTESGLSGDWLGDPTNSKIFRTLNPATIPLELLTANSGAGYIYVRYRNEAGFAPTTLTPRPLACDTPGTSQFDPNQCLSFSEFPWSDTEETESWILNLPSLPSQGKYRLQITPGASADTSVGIDLEFAVQERQESSFPLKATTGDGRIRLEWFSPEWSSALVDRKFIVERVSASENRGVLPNACDPSVRWTLRAVGNGFQFEEGQLINGAAYQYRVIAIRPETGELDWQTTPPLVPAPILSESEQSAFSSSLSANPHNGAIELQWNNLSGQRSPQTKIVYSVYHFASTNLPGDRIAQYASNETNNPAFWKHLHEPVANGTTHHYRVIASVDGLTDFSTSLVRATPNALSPPLSPGNISIRKVSSLSVPTRYLLHWDPSAGARAYQVRYRIKGSTNCLGQTLVGHTQAEIQSPSILFDSDLEFSITAIGTGGAESEVVYCAGNQFVSATQFGPVTANSPRLDADTVEFVDLIAPMDPAGGIARVYTPTNITLRASVAFSGRQVTKVEFYCNDQLIGESTAPPYTFDWVNPPSDRNGPLRLLAVAALSDGARKSSPERQIDVRVRPPLSGFSHVTTDFALKSGADVFELHHGYNSQDSTDGILGRGWKFNFEHARLIRPNLSTGWRVVGTGLANLYARIQETTPGHEISITLPDGTPLRFVATANFTSTLTQHEIEWLQITGNPTDDTDTVRVEFVSVDGSGAVLEALDAPDLVGISFGDTLFQDGHQILNCSLGNTTLPYAPNHFVVRLPNGWAYEFRTTESIGDVNPTALRLYRIASPHDLIFQFATCRADGTPVIGAGFSHVDTRRIAIQALSTNGVMVRECWLDRLSGPVITWALYDPIAIQLARAALVTNANALLPGSVAALPVLRIDRNANRVEAVSQLQSRTGASYHTHRFGYSLIPGNPTRGVPSQELLTSITAPDSSIMLQNQYELRDDLFCLVSQRDSRGNVRTFSYTDPSRVVSSTSSPAAEGFTEAITLTPNGEPSEFVDATGVRTLYTRDDRGRVILEATGSSVEGQPIQPTIAYRYDEHDNPVEATDALGNTSLKEFDPQRRIIAESDANQNVSHYLYSEKADPDGGNPAGSLISVLDAEGTNTEFRYNARGQITARICHLADTSALSITRYDYYETNSVYGRIGDLRRIYEPLSIACQSLDTPLPTLLPVFATEFTYDENGNTRTLSKLRTIRTVATNTLGAAAESTAYERTTTTATHDPANRPIEVTLHRWQLDSSFNIQPNSELLLERRITTFDHAGRETQTKDRLGRSVRSLYDLQGNLIQVLYADGTVQRTVMDSLGRRSLVQERARPSTTPGTTNSASSDTTAPAIEYVYDAAGRTVFVKQRVDVQLRVQPEINYAGFSSTNPIQFTCVNVTAATVWSTNVLAIHRYVHDLTGRLRYHVNPEGGLVENVYDNANRIAAVLQYEDKAFPLDQSPIDTSNVRSLATRHGYDGVGNRIWSLEPSTATQGGHLIEETLRTDYQYDRLNRLTVTRLPLHRGKRAVEQIQYDALGNKAVVTDPNGISTRYGYDLHGRLISIALDWNPDRPDSAQVNQTRYDYDEFGNLIAQLDSEGRRTRYEYDALGRRRNRILPGGGLLSTPSGGDMESTEFASIPATSTQAGVFMEQRTIQSPGGAIIVSQFDPLDRLSLRVTRASASAPIESMTRYEYTDWGAPARILEYRGVPLPTTPTRTTEYLYQAGTRRLESKSSPEGKISYRHNRTQQVTRMVATLGGAFLTGSLYEYDPLGRLLGVRRLSSATDPSGISVANYQRGKSGQVESVDFGNGVVTRREYNARNQLTRIVHQRGSAVSSPEIASFTYDTLDMPLDGNGNRYTTLESFTGLSLSQSWSSASQRARRINYSYDRLGRLVREEAQAAPALPGSLLGTAGFVTYAQDKVGNRLTRTPSTSLQTVTPPQGPNRYDVQDHPDPDTNPNTRSPWVDLAGNTIQIPVSPSTAVPSGDTYDPLARLMVHRQSGSATYWTYGYDDRGNRVSKKAEGAGMGAETRFLMDDKTPRGLPQVIAEWRVEGGVTNIVRTYQVGLELVCQEDGPSGLNRRYFLTDALGSTRVLANDSGYPLHLFQYDAFGRTLGRLDWTFSGTNGGSWASASAPLGGLPTQHLFAGEYWDNDLQLAYHRARYYSPGLGRFWTPDTYEGNQTRPASLHRYVYAEGDPVNLLDPSGHSSMGDVLTSIAVRATMAARSTGPLATGIRSALAVLTLASAAHDPAAFVASFESPNAAMGVLAADAGFVLYYTRRAVSFATGFIAARMEIRPAVEEILSQSAQRLRQLDANALVGFRGSVARGYKGPHKGNDPFDPNHFDVDGFVVSDKLAAKIPKIRGARFADARNSPELAAEQQRIDGELRSKLTGLKDDQFTFRVFTYQEYFKKFKDGILIEE